mgnify:CR=1 FL=1
MKIVQIIFYIAVIILAIVGIFVVTGHAKSISRLTCSDLTQAEAIKALQNGATYLDRDKDNLPCE